MHILQWVIGFYREVKGDRTLSEHMRTGSEH
jgi:hypothetical protein